MTMFKGVITAITPIQSGTSKAGKQWSKIDAVLTYDNSKPEYPKTILFSVMNDNISKFDLRQGLEYEVEVDFSVREYNGRYYMSASAWKVAATQSQPAAQTVAPQSQMPKGDSSDDLPF